MQRRAYYFVDGYNLLHQLFSQRRLNAPGSLARARLSMIRTIANQIPPQFQNRITIVFDSDEKRQASDNAVAESDGHAMTIHFSNEFENADEMIEHLIKKHSSPRQIIVVSNDRQVQTSATRRGATFVTSLDWYESLAVQFAKHKSSDSNPKDAVAEIRNEPLDEQQRNYWLREFGIDDEG